MRTWRTTTIISAVSERRAAGRGGETWSWVEPSRLKENFPCGFFAFFHALLVSFSSLLRDGF